MFPPLSVMLIRALFRSPDADRIVLVCGRGSDYVPAKWMGQGNRVTFSAFAQSAFGVEAPDFWSVEGFQAAQNRMNMLRALALASGSARR